MTTMTPEAATLPRATINNFIITGLNPGDQYPYLAVDNAPTGTRGCLILPADHAAGWVINNLSHEAVRGFTGMRGWWVRESEVTIDESERTEVAMHVVDHTIDLTEVPAEHRAAVPENARWCIANEAIDGVVREGDRLLCIPAPDHRTDDGPILLAWPGHQYHSAFGSRPGVPAEWYGFWSMQRVTVEEPTTVEPTTEPHPGEWYVPGQLVEVHGHGNNGSSPWNGEARFIRYDEPYLHVVKIDTTTRVGDRQGGFNPSAIRPVERDFAEGDRVVLGEPHVTEPGGHQYTEAPSGVGSFGVLGNRSGGRAGCWGITWEGSDRHSTIHECCIRLAAPAEPEQAVENNGHLVAGNWFSWSGRAYWYRIQRVEGDVIHYDQHVQRNADSPVSDVGQTAVANATTRDNSIVVGPHTTDWEGLPVYLRDLFTQAERTPPQVGEWFTWGGHNQWFRCSGVSGNTISVDRIARPGEAVRGGAGGPFAFDVMRNYQVVNAESGDAIPEILRGEFTVDPTAQFVPGHWYTWEDSRRWYEIDRVHNGRVYHSRRVEKSDGHETRSPGGRSLEQLALPHGPYARGLTFYGPESPDIPENLRRYIVAAETPSVAVPEGEETVESLRARLAEVQAAYDADMAAIANVMQGEAEDRGWCDEYEEVVGRINEHTTATFAGERTRQWDVDYTTTVQVQVTGRVRVEVPRSATGHDIQEAARTLLREQGFEQSGRLGTPAWGEVDPDIARIIDYNAR